MLSKYILPGDRVELTPIIRQKMNDDGTVEKKVYLSKVCDIVSEERLEIVMPMEKTKLILLPVDGEYNICFYTKSGIFQCGARIIDRYKSDGIYLLLFEVMSNLKRNQRREFYRYNCVLNMGSRELTEQELEVMGQPDAELDLNLPLHNGVIVDISGGGLRFVSEAKYEQETVIYLTYTLLQNGLEKVYDLTAKILTVKEVENKKGLYEHRVQYMAIDSKAQEEIIRYIFEEERKNRQKK